jgi:hypothetical protein
MTESRPVIVVGVVVARLDDELDPARGKSVAVEACLVSTWQGVRWTSTFSSTSTLSDGGEEAPGEVLGVARRFKP